MNHFKSAKKLFKPALQTLAQEKSEEIDEAAIPAYAHRNPFIDYLFWKRLEISLNYINQHKSRASILDFGFGSGVFSYMLAQSKHRLTAVDISLYPLQKMRDFVDFPQEISFLEGDIRDMSFTEGFDVIVALDVLEHLDHLDEYLALFQKRLKPDGFLIVSGPTENFLYKMGRKIAGNRFSGHYHLNTILNIKQSHKAFFDVETISSLFFLFEVFVARHKSETTEISSL